MENRCRYLRGHIALTVGLLAVFSLVTGAIAANDNQDTTATEAEEQSPPPPQSTPVPLFQMHYENRVKSFREQNRVYQNVVLLGDSITEGFVVDKYLPGRRVLNRGIGSDVVGNNLPDNDKRGVLKRLDESIFHCAPSAVFILIGINDIAMGHSPEVIEQGYRELLQKIRERRPKLKVYVQSVLPGRGRFTVHNENVLDLNRRLQKLAGEFDCEYVDLHALMADDKGELKEEFTYDGLHLTEPAYHQWRSVVFEKMGW